jgi:hypothetical protein
VSRSCGPWEVRKIPSRGVRGQQSGTTGNHPPPASFDRPFVNAQGKLRTGLPSREGSQDAIWWVTKGGKVGNTLTPLVCRQGQSALYSCVVSRPLL